MPKRLLTPSLRKHSNGSAYCKWRGRYHYFGAWKSPDMIAWKRFLAEQASGAMHEAATGSMGSSDIKISSRPSECGLPTLADLIAAYVKNRTDRYRSPDDAENLSKYRFRWKHAYEPLLKMYGAALVNEFGPKALKAVRNAIMAGKSAGGPGGAGQGGKPKKQRSRTYVNDLMAEIRLAFQWGVGEELVPVTIYQAIREVKPLRAGECDIPEGKEVQPVPLELVRATLPFLSPEVAGIVELMMYTVSRPGEIAKITAEMIDKNGPEGAWVYWLGKHKMAWRGKKRFLVFGKEAQVVLKRHWKATGFFFVNERTGKKFTSEQIRKAIVWGCKRAGLAYWYPYQIRHATYSKTSLEHGAEAAALLAGHSNGKMAARYDHSKVARAAKVAGG